MEMNRTAVAQPNCLAEKLHAEFHHSFQSFVVHA